jgi:hypothetical protein
MTLTEPLKISTTIAFIDHTLSNGPSDITKSETCSA